MATYTVCSIRRDHADEIGSDEQERPLVRHVGVYIARCGYAPYALGIGILRAVSLLDFFNGDLAERDLDLSPHH